MNLWIDLDNSPHVLFFAPIIRELKEQGVDVVITTREFAQTRGLAEQHGLKFTAIGRHYGSGKTVVKVAGTVLRAAQLARFISGRRISAAISHGSRSMLLAARALRIPVMTLYDYEYVSCRAFNVLSQRVMAPDVVPEERLTSQGLETRKLARYPGLKEEAYVYGFVPDLGVIDRLGLDRKKLIVTIRPPAGWAHYQHDLSEILFGTLMERLKREPNARVVIPARTEAQEQELRSKYNLESEKFVIFTQPVDGLSLMWCSDLVFSGGGTMTREAALLGLNVYSIFGGRLGAADEALVKEGKLVMLREPAEIDHLVFSKRLLPERPPEDRKQLASYIAKEILAFARDCTPGDLAGVPDPLRTSL